MPPANKHTKWHTWPDGVEYTDDNDHNPLVKEECPACSGIGEREELVERVTEQGPRQNIEWIRCAMCNGSGRGERLVRLFDNDSPTVPVEVGPDGWLTCPCCKWRFTTRDSNVWTGRRHKKCGQRITPVPKQEA